MKKLSRSLLFAGLVSLLVFGVALAGGGAGVITWTPTDVYSSSDRFFDVNVTSVPTANCVMEIGAFDVDYPGPTNPENDQIFLNGHFVMRLEGQTDQDSVTSASFDCSWLQQGNNKLAVYVLNKSWLVTLRYISISGTNLAGSIGEVTAGRAHHWQSVHVLNADGSPYKPVPKTDLLIFSVGDAAWLDGKSVAEAVNSNLLVFDPGVILLEDGSRGPGIGTAGFPGPKDGGYFAMAIAAPGKPLKYLGTAYVPPSNAARELHCHEFKLGTLGAHTCPN